MNKVRKETNLIYIGNRKFNLSVSKKVAVSLYYLASCCEYRIVANQFGIHKATVCKTIHEFVKATNKILIEKYLHFPNETEAITISSHFEQRSKIPNIIGFIDGTHIPILPPSKGYRDFVNRKGWPSLILQAVVDAEYKFIDISIKTTGRSHDSTALMNSYLYKNINDLIPKVNISNVFYYIYF